MTDDPQTLKPPTALLMGGVGSGKTTALTTYIEAGLKLVVVITEPHGVEALLDSVERNKLPLDNLHYHYVPFASSHWDTLKDLTKKIGMMGYDDLSRLKSGISKAGYQQVKDLLEVLSDFTCQRSGTHLGPIDELDETYAFAFDSVTGLNQMCKDVVVGAKPTMHEGEWGTAMNLEERIINKLTSDLKCFFCMNTHMNKQFVEIEGRNMKTPALLGNKLAPVVPRMFSDVIVAQRNADKFTWSTIATDSDTKNSNLPLSDTIEPSFVPIVESYRKRKALIATTTKGDSK